MAAGTLPDDVVFLRASMCIQVKFRFFPVDPIATFCVAGHFHVGGAKLIVDQVKVITSVVKSIGVAILDDGVVARGSSLPRFGVLDDLLSRNRMM